MKARKPLEFLLPLTGEEEITLTLLNARKRRVFAAGLRDWASGLEAGTLPLETAVDLLRGKLCPPNRLN